MGRFARARVGGVERAYNEMSLRWYEADFFGPGVAIDGKAQQGHHHNDDQAA